MGLIHKLANLRADPIQSVERILFPNQILNRLERSICHHLSVKHTAHSTAAPCIENRTTGIVYVAKPFPGCPIKKATEAVILFYKKEGFSIENEDIFSEQELGIKRGDQNYGIKISEDKEGIGFIVHVYILSEQKQGILA